MKNKLFLVLPIFIILLINIGSAVVQEESTAKIVMSYTDYNDWRYSLDTYFKVLTGRDSSCIEGFTNHYIYILPFTNKHNYPYEISEFDKEGQECFREGNCNYFPDVIVSHYINKSKKPIEYVYFDKPTHASVLVSCQTRIDLKEVDDAKYMSFNQGTLQISENASFVKSHSWINYFYSPQFSALNGERRLFQKGYFQGILTDVVFHFRTEKDFAIFLNNAVLEVNTDGTFSLSIMDNEENVSEDENHILKSTSVKLNDIDFINKSHLIYFIRTPSLTGYRVIFDGDEILNIDYSEFKDLYNNNYDSPYFGVFDGGQSSFNDTRGTFYIWVRPEPNRNAFMISDLWQYGISSQSTIMAGRKTIDDYDVSNADDVKQYYSEHFGSFADETSNQELPTEDQMNFIEKLVYGFKQILFVIFNLGV